METKEKKVKGVNYKTIEFPLGVLLEEEIKPCGNRTYKNYKIINKELKEDE